MSRRAQVLVLVALAASASCHRSAGGAAGVLGGRWNIELTLVSPGAIGAEPVTSEIRGRVSLSARLAQSAFWWGYLGPDSAFAGRSEVDFAPFYGSDFMPDLRRVFRSADTAFVEELVGWTYGPDSIAIDFIPRGVHGGVSARGVIRGDSAVGEWTQRAYCCGPSGSFRMHRFDRRVPRVEFARRAPLSPTQAPDTLGGSSGR